MSLTIITGWIAAVLLFFNFTTCLVMPWSRKHLQECDGKGGCHETTLGRFHKPIAWLSILAIILHVVVALVT